jgi:hypothetical protein
MHDNTYYKILNNAHHADPKLAELHLSSFVESFLTKGRRERWKALLAKQNFKTYTDASKLEGCLDTHQCETCVSPVHVLHTIKGVFYNFVDSPLIVSGKDALILGLNRDAIFSSRPGKSAFFFSHEGRLWLCQK